jgi:hypothetical protein
LRQGLAVVGDDGFAVGAAPSPGVRVSLGAARNRAELARALAFISVTLKSSVQSTQVV